MVPNVKIYGLYAKNIRSSKIYSPQTLKIYRRFTKIIRPHNIKYTVLTEGRHGPMADSTDTGTFIPE